MYRRFSFSISTSNEYSGFISSRIDWFHLLLSKGLSRVFSSTKKIKPVTVSTFPPSFCHEMMGLDAMIFFFFFFFWMLCFKQVIGKKWIYLERNILRRQSVGHLGMWETEIVGFYGLGNFIGKSVGGLFQLFGGRGRDFQELVTTHFFGWPQNCHDAGESMAIPPSTRLISSWCWWVCHLICYNENTFRHKVRWESNILPSWT